MVERYEPEVWSARSFAEVLEKHLGIPPHTTRVVIDINLATGAVPVVYVEALGHERLVEVIEAMPPQVKIVRTKTEYLCIVCHGDLTAANAPPCRVGPDGLVCVGCDGDAPAADRPRAWQKSDEEGCTVPKCDDGRGNVCAVCHAVCHGGLNAPLGTMHPAGDGRLVCSLCYHATREKRVADG